MGSFGYHSESSCLEFVENSSWKHMKMGVEYGSFAGVPPTMVEHFQETVVPRSIEYLSRVLQVRSPEGGSRLLYSRPCHSTMFGFCVAAYRESYAGQCGSRIVSDPDMIDGLEIMSCPEGTFARACKLDHTIPPGKGGITGGEDLHLHIDFVSMKDAYAKASVCGEDFCGRATIGLITVSNALLSMGTDDMINTVVHEIIHILGFSMRAFNKFIDRDTGGMLVSRNKQFSVVYAIHRKENGDPVKAEFLSSIGPSEIFAHGTRSVFVKTIPYGVVGAVRGARGFSPNTCRCPMDPSGSYTHADLMSCLGDKGSCIFAVRTKNVVRETRKYYNCQHAVGMELEIASIDEYFLDSHWKYRNLAHEVMNAICTNRPQFISPMTLALLEDSGWYLVDYDFGATRLVPGVMWGYQDGCAILEDSCSKPLNVPFTKEFNQIAGESGRGALCSASGFGYSKYTKHHDMWEQLTMFQYNGNGSEDWEVEFCPIGAPLSAYSCATADNRFKARCVDKIGQNGENIPICVQHVQCNTDRTKYTFQDPKGNEATCTYNAEKTADGKYLCIDPTVMCARLKYPHLTKSPQLSVSSSDEDDDDEEEEDTSTITSKHRHSKKPKARRAQQGDNSLPTHTKSFTTDSPHSLIVVCTILVSLV